jgi:hypothetical protein
MSKNQKPTPATIQIAKKFIEMAKGKVFELRLPSTAIGDILLQENGGFHCCCDTRFGKIHIHGTGRFYFVSSPEGKEIEHFLLPVAC